MHYGRGAAEQVRLRLHRRRLPRPTCCCASRTPSAASPSTRTCARSCRRAASRRTSTPSVKAMHVSRPREKTDIDKILRRVTESVASRGMIVIVSDLLVDREPLFKRPGNALPAAARHPRLPRPGRRRDDFPFAGTTRFEGMEELPQLMCDPRRLRDGYLEALEEYLVEVRRGCTRLGIDYAAGPHRRLPRRGADASSCTTAWPSAPRRRWAVTAASSIAQRASQAHART